MTIASAEQKTYQPKVSRQSRMFIADNAAAIE